MTFPDTTAETATNETATAETTVREITLREMTWRDIPALTALEPVLFADDAWAERTWWAELAGRPRRCYVVAERGGTVVGYAGLDRGGEVADVMTIAVAPAAQGQGLGAVLMRWLIAEARRAGAEHLMLEVRADNPVAQRLYSTAGFARLSVRRKYYQPGDVDALIMRMHLSDMAGAVTDDSTENLTDDLRRNLADGQTENLADGSTEDSTEQPTGQVST